MKTLTCQALPRPSLQLWFASALLMGLCSAGMVRAEERPEPNRPADAKKEFIEMPLIRQRKAELAAAAAAAQASAPAATAKGGSEAVRQLREALSIIGTPRTTSGPQAPDHGMEGDAPKPAGAAAARRRPRQAGEVLQTSRQYIEARALALAAQSQPANGAQADAQQAHAGEAHWAYEGEHGPQNWARLKPEFNLCAIGKRQSPIAIDSEMTLQGPAEPLVFNYTPSGGSVVNNGHTVQVDVEGDNTLMVRRASYRLLQFHFHTPSEEVINARRYPMVAHLVHRDDAGQLAVVAVLLELGEPSPFIDKVWTYMPLDANDRVRLPEGLLDLRALLPQDQRYYQYLGSLTTPPCTEGVLWMVLKQPVTISQAQLRLFRQLFPQNARPVQALNGRPVRDAQ